MGKTGYKNCFWLQATCSGVIGGKLECEIGIVLQYENIFKFSLKKLSKEYGTTVKQELSFIFLFGILGLSDFGGEV